MPRNVLVAALVLLNVALPAAAQAEVAVAEPVALSTMTQPVAEPLAPAPPSAAASVASGRATRVYVAPFTGETSDPATLDLVEDRVLVAARSAVARVGNDAGGAPIELIGARDVQSILDVEASKAAVGCDTTSCANEIADALNADEILFGQLGRIGDTWQLTLTRTQRATLRVLGRSVKEARGDTPEGLLAGIGTQVDELFGIVSAGPSVITVVGMGTTALGVVAVVVGGLAYAYSWSEWVNADTILKTSAPDVVQAKQHENTGRSALTFAYVTGGVGVGVAAIGAALWFLGGDE